MPAAYAHHRFGSECIGTMPADLQKICEENRELFDFGVHGPDIFFYYKPLSKNQVNGFGNAMHGRTGRVFFEKTAPVLSRTESRPAMLAYLLGFLAHFTLDSFCHGHINDQAARGPFSHNYIESQYEAFLMRTDGRDPLSLDRSKTLHPSKDSAEIISELFPMNKEEVLKSLRGQVTFLHLFYSPTERKKKLIQKLIRGLRIGGSFDDLFLDREELPACAETNRQIFDLQQQALEKYPVLMDSFMKYLAGEGELIPDFDKDFEGILHE